MIATKMVSKETVTKEMQDRFEELLPRIETHAKITFRGVRCQATREEAMQECRALAWKLYRRLVQRGKDVGTFKMVFVFVVVRSVKCGRRTCGSEKAKDVLSPLAQRRHGFNVESLPTSTRTSVAELYANPHGQRDLDAFKDHLADDTTTPILDRVAFRLDWPRFFRSLPKRDRRLARFLSLGNTNKEAPSKFRLSPGRVTQLRQRWCREWRTFQGE